MRRTRVRMCIGTRRVYVGWNELYLNGYMERRRFYRELGEDKGNLLLVVEKCEMLMGREEMWVEVSACL